MLITKEIYFKYKKMQKNCGTYPTACHMRKNGFSKDNAVFVLAINHKEDRFYERP